MIDENRLHDSDTRNASGLQGFGPASTAETAIPTTSAGAPATGPASDDDTAVLDWVREFIRRGEAGTQQRVSKESGVKSSTLSQLLSGSYKGDVGKQIVSLRKWKAQREVKASAAASAPAAIGYVETPSSLRVMQALSYAQTMGDIAVLHGGWGIGKTESARQYQQARPNVWLVTVDPTTRGVGPLLECLAEAVGLKDMPLHPARLRRSILSRISGSEGLIIVDEAQHLSEQAIEALRSVHDACGIGLAFLGNDHLHNSLASKTDRFGQFFSRIGYRVRFAKIDGADVVALATAYGIAGKDELAYLQKIGKTAGALRRVVKVIKFARVLAQANGGAVALDHLQLAVRHTGRAEEVM